MEGADSAYLYDTIHRGVDARKELAPKIWEAFKDNSGKLYYKIVYAESEKYFFKITAWCLAAHIKKHLGTFEKILQSFRLVL